MTDKSVNIIWRKNDTYNDINSLLDNIIYENQINILNFTDDNLEIENNDKITTITNYNEEDIYVNNIIKDILEEDKSKQVYIIDSCILYDSVIDLQISNSEFELLYIQINSKKNSMYLPIYYNLEKYNIENINSLDDKNINNSQILLEGSLDENFLLNYYDINLNNQRNIKLLLIEYLLDRYIVDINRHIPKNTLEIHYLGIIKYLKNNDFKCLINSFRVSEITYDGLLYLINAENDNNKSLIRETIIKNISKTPKRGIFRIRNLDKDKIYNYIIECLITKLGSRFRIKDIPTWIDDKFKYKLYEYYPTLVSRMININGDIQITESIKYLDTNTFIVNGKKLIMDSSTTSIDGTKFHDKCYTFLYFNNKHILLMNSIDPLKLNIAKDGKLVEIFSYEQSFKNIEIVGPIIPFFNRYISLLKVQEKLYKIAVFEKDNVKLVGLSKIFKISEGIPQSFRVSNNNLQILCKKDSQLLIADIDHVKLFTEICKTIDIDDIFTLEIKERNNIKLSLEGYTNFMDEYDDFVFNKQDEEILCTVKYNPKLRIFDINSRKIYHKDFIYLPNNIAKQEKTADLFFYNKDDDDKLLKKCTEMGLTVTDCFEQAKYYIIEHKYFEKLDSIELSKIIENNCLIISLIENADINSPNFIKTYTSNSSITKLYLFNIAKNDTYIEFIFDKIIHDNQYEARLQYMEIDKNKIFNETNIYKTILSLREKCKTDSKINLSEKGSDILNILKNKKIYKEFKYNKNMEYLAKYIISKNFNLEIGYQVENKEANILKMISKINFMGNTLQFSVDKSSEYSLVIADNEDLLTSIDNFSSPVIIYIIDNDTLIQI